MKVTVLKTNAGDELYRSLCGIPLVTRCGKDSKEFMVGLRNDQDQSVLLIERNTSPANSFTVIAAEGDLVVLSEDAQDAITALQIVGICVLETKNLTREVMSVNELREIAQAIRRGAAAA